MQRLRWSGSTVLAATVLVTGCSAESPDPGSSRDLEPARGTDTDNVGTVVYMVDLHAKRDRNRAPLPYGVVPVSLPGTALPELSADRKRTSAAVEALLHQPGGRHETLWAGECAPGAGVSAVRIGNGQVTVLLEGPAADSCDLDRAMTGLQAQQLAWTVLENSDLPRDVAVSSVDESGHASERWVADPDMVVKKQRL